MGKNWWIIPATIIAYIAYKKYAIAKTFSVFFKTIDFSPMSILNPTINLVVQVNNPTDITATIQNITGTLTLNGQQIGYVRGISPTLLEIGSSDLNIPVTLEYGGVSYLVQNFSSLKSSGVKLSFRGTIMVDYITLPLNFDY